MVFFPQENLVMHLTVSPPQKLTVHLSVNNTINNSWDIWVYPRRELKRTDAVYGGCSLYDGILTTGLNNSLKKEGKLSMPHAG